MERPTLHGRSILVVDDEPIIALDIAQAFERVGAQVVMSTTLHDAMVLVEHDSLSGAVLDHALQDGDSTPLCERLKERNLPFVIYSGLSKLEGPCAAGKHIAKPQHPDMLVSMLGDLLTNDARPAQ